MPIKPVCASCLRHAARGLAAIAALLCTGAVPLRAAAEHIAVNDNRVAAGAVQRGTLTLRLEMREGEWHPDGDNEPGVTVRSFAIEGGPLQIPGPVIRVPEGTTIHVSVHNPFAQSFSVHGLYSRPAKTDADAGALLVSAGETRDVTFLAGRPGTYYYWAARPDVAALADRPGVDSQLSGALIVDPPGGNLPGDRILLISLWGNAVAGRYVINGLSWPHTERLGYRVGDTVRLRVVNAGAAAHPMHLHGFYFNVDSRGNEREDVTFAATASPHMVVTERLTTGRTFALTWTPTRPGNWLFHCHDNEHLKYGGTVDGSPSSRDDAHHHMENHALEGMSGPIVGITITGAATDAADQAVQRRQLRLIARSVAGGSASEPAFAYALEDPARPGTAVPQLPGPMILLKRGEPVSITVVNELAEDTAVHWHGIELESYYDGVAGFAGEGAHIAPAIPPGGSFEARFTPPRSGTFIYHTHIDEVRQQQAGLSGPLIVVDSPTAFDPQHDLILMVTAPRTNPNANVVLLNGSPAPAAIEMRAGDTYRLRFINIHINRPGMRMRVLRDTTLLTWRSIAKDGRDLPADQAIEGASEIQMGNGETYDFEFVPKTKGDLRIDVTSGKLVQLASVPIHVR